MKPRVTVAHLLGQMSTISWDRTTDRCRVRLRLTGLPWLQLMGVTGVDGHSSVRPMTAIGAPTLHDEAWSEPTVEHGRHARRSGVQGHGIRPSSADVLGRSTSRPFRRAWL